MKYVEELYHIVYTLDRLRDILNKGLILKDKKILNPCVYLTRDFNYLSGRGIRMVFDKKSLKNNYKIKPFCYKGWCEINNHKFNPNVDEMEERVYNNIEVNKHCIRIDIDKNIHPQIPFYHPLINHTKYFKQRFIK